MKLILIILIILISFHFETKAQKNDCYNAIAKGRKIDRVLIRKLKRSVRNQDSSFIYYTGISGHFNRRYGISAYKKNGKIIVSEFLLNGNVIENRNIDGEERNIIEQFYTDEIFNDTQNEAKEALTGSRIYFADDAPYEIIVFKSKKVCWVYGPYAYGFSESTSIWEIYFSDFVMKRKSEIDGK